MTPTARRQLLACIALPVVGLLALWRYPIAFGWAPIPPMPANMLRPYFPDYPNYPNGGWAPATTRPAPAHSSTQVLIRVAVLEVKSTDIETVQALQAAQNHDEFDGLFHAAQTNGSVNVLARPYLLTDLRETGYVLIGHEAPLGTGHVNEIAVVPSGRLSRYAWTFAGYVIGNVEITTRISQDGSSIELELHGEVASNSRLLDLPYPDAPPASGMELQRPRPIAGRTASRIDTVLTFADGETKLIPLSKAPEEGAPAPGARSAMVVLTPRLALYPKAIVTNTKESATRPSPSGQYLQTQE